MAIEAYKEQKDDKTVRNPLARALNNLINQAPYDKKMLQRMQGRFLVYRKDFVDDEHVMVMVLSCAP